ncbi:MAG: hypothetical protein QXV09_06325 [Candidatus Bathyarchaeia archaeon]
MLGRLQALTDAELEKIRQAFIQQNHPRFMKHFSWNNVYGSKKIMLRQLRPQALKGWRI